MSRLTVIFPNKRAGLFLNDFLTDDERPLWAPRYMTINEFFQVLSPLHPNDVIDTVCRIYAHYRELTESDESLDHFYGWGERLLADFDDLDKNLGEASLVFRDLKDYGEIGADEFLTSEQAEQLQRFVGDFSTSERSIVRERFLRLWHAIPKIYEALRNELQAEGLAYEGQLFRQVVEHWGESIERLPNDTEYVAFIGFNVLDAVEKRLFSLLKEEGRALFYWDYDTYYVGEGTENNEAGVFLTENLRLFPNELHDEADFDNFLRGRTDRTSRPLVFASADTESAQAQYVTQWLTSFPDLQGERAKRTAVVLCNENLLQPVLHALPSGMLVNVTKGFPMSHTAAFSFLATEMELMEQEAATRALALNKVEKKEPSNEELMAQLQRLSQRVEDKALDVSSNDDRDEWLHTLYVESFYTVYTTLARFMQIVESGRLKVEMPTLFRLIRAVLRLSSVAFHGEPAVGLQVMGVLETRCLDFDRVLMLSVGEGILPQRATDASFIPFLIRKRYGLTTYVHKTAVYSYYFHRLLQRAENVCLTYNVSTEGTTRGEMSRFMRAMLIDPRISDHITRMQLSSRPLPHPFVPNIKIVPRSSEQPFKVSFSPTAINTYLSCPREFYFKYLLKLKTPETTEGIIDQRDFGIVFHKAAENIYSSVIGTNGTTITPQRLKRFLEEKGEVVIEDEVKKAFASEGVARTPIVEAAIKSYVKQLLHYEAGMCRSQTPALDFSVKKTEYKLVTTLSVPFGKEGKLAKITLEGTIDRLDLATLPDGTHSLRVIDYKTGGKPMKVNTMDDMFVAKAKEQPKYQLQTFLYSLLLSDNLTKEADKQYLITPSLFFVKGMRNKDFVPYVTFADNILYDVRPLLSEVRMRLVRVLSEIIDPDNPFENTGVKDHCKYCIYKPLCGKKEDDIKY